MDYRLLLFDNFILPMRLLTDRNNKTVVSTILHLKKAAVLYLNQAAVSLRLPQTNDDLLTEHGGIYWRYAVLIIFNTHPPNLLRSKKAITHRRDITALNMN